MLVDASACRNLRLENRRPYLLKAAAFALTVGNFEYALACLRKAASKEKFYRDCSETDKLQLT